jgi:hypothetical protein
MIKDIEIFPEYTEDPNGLLDEMLEEFENEFISSELKEELGGGIEDALPSVYFRMRKKIRNLDQFFRVYGGNIL